MKGKGSGASVEVLVCLAEENSENGFGWIKGSSLGGEGTSYSMGIKGV